MHIHCFHLLKRSQIARRWRVAENTPIRDDTAFWTAKIKAYCRHPNQPIIAWHSSAARTFRPDAVRSFCRDASLSRRFDMIRWNRLWVDRRRQQAETGAIQSHMGWRVGVTRGGGGVTRGEGKGDERGWVIADESEQGRWHLRLSGTGNGIGVWDLRLVKIDALKLGYDRLASVLLYSAPQIRHVIWNM